VLWRAALTWLQGLKVAPGNPVMRRGMEAARREAQKLFLMEADESSAEESSDDSDSESQ
jgi:hypothetical protein